MVHGICARRLAFIVEESGAIIDENDGKPKNTDKNHLFIKKHYLHEGGNYQKKKAGRAKMSEASHLENSHRGSQLLDYIQ